MKALAFFNNKGGVGKTTLVSHLAFMFADRGIQVLAVDLDPQSNLTSMFLDDPRLKEIWEEEKTVAAAIKPLVERESDIIQAHAEPITPRLDLLAGDLTLSNFEDLLSTSWTAALTGRIAEFRVMSAFHRMIREAAQRQSSELVLIDLGPNLGPLNRAAILAADHIVLPIAPDIFSIRGLENFGPILRDWRRDWVKRLEALQGPVTIPLPSGSMKPMGYVLMSFGERDSRPVKAYDDWTSQIPAVYKSAVLGESAQPPRDSAVDPHQLAALKHYRSLMPLAMTARKPMFLLNSADGARGAHLDAVKRCYADFLALAKRIGKEIGIVVP